MVPISHSTKVRIRTTHALVKKGLVDVLLPKDADDDNVGIFLLIVD